MTLRLALNLTDRQVFAKLEPRSTTTSMLWCALALCPDELSDNLVEKENVF
jgi:hypothetical protein